MLVSHNTFTYMKPLKWWMYLLIPTAKCQFKTLEEQIKSGVTVFDIRVRWYKGDFYICHGPSIYYPATKAIQEITQLVSCKPTIRLLLEGDRQSYFNDWVDWILDNYDINFIECRQKETWRQLKSAKSIDFPQYVGSMQSKYGAIFPFLYYLFNKKSLRQKMSEYKHTTEYASFDFI